jgi:uridylate kinase
MPKKYLIKLSGEALGIDGRLFDVTKFDKMAEAIVSVTADGSKAAIVLGGGNLWRGRTGVLSSVNPVTADQIGMVGTLMNALMMRDSLERKGAKATVLSAFDAPKFAVSYTQRDALRVWDEGGIIVFAGGTGHPFFSTDTGAALRAIELDVDSILLAKSIDGVYDKDPAKHDDAKLLPKLTYDDAINNNLGVMDMTAMVMLRERKIPEVRVFALDEKDSIVRAARGEHIGSIMRL